jgi:hypothetical protein
MRNTEKDKADQPKHPTDAHRFIQTKGKCQGYIQTNKFTEGQHSHFYGDCQTVNIHNHYHKYGGKNKELAEIIARLERHGLDPKQLMLEAPKKVRENKKRGWPYFTFSVAW